MASEAAGAVKGTNGMNPLFEFVLYLFLLATAILALQLRNLMAAALASAVFSLIAALLYASMGAVDVAFTEAVVGAGVVGVFFLTAIYKTSRKSSD